MRGVSWSPLPGPQLGTWPATQACAQTRHVSTTEQLDPSWTTIAPPPLFPGVPLRSAAGEGVGAL